MTLSGFENEELSGLMYAVWYDSPELFCVDPFVWVHTVTTYAMNRNSVSRVEFDCLFETSGLADMREDYERRIRAASLAVLPCRTDARKASALHGWLLGHTEYDMQVADRVADGVGMRDAVAPGETWGEDDLLPRSATAYGALVDGKALCGGYSQLFCALCREAGLECRTFIGSVDGYDDGHAWNAVLIEGEWRYVDPTWNDGANGGRGFKSAHDMLEAALAE